MKAYENEVINVMLTLKVKASLQKEFMAFLHNNIPNVKRFEGCHNLELFLNEEGEEAVILEEWFSKECHEKYISYITHNGVMEELVSFLSTEPLIHYYKKVNI